jgi:hypothetical protein
VVPGNGASAVKTEKGNAFSPLDKAAEIAYSVNENNSQLQAGRESAMIRLGVRGCHG